MPTEPASPKLPPGSLPTPFPRILCAVDGSRPCTEAIDQALTLAGHEADLTFLTVSDARGFGPTRMASLGPHSADEALESARRAARAAGVQAHMLVRHSDDPRRVILQEASTRDLLVLGTHGEHRSAGSLLGGIPATALHQAPVPVLIARKPRAGATFPRQILLATDGSPAMGRAVTATAALAQRHDARVTLLHVSRTDHEIRHELAEEIATLIEATGSEPVLVELEGHAAPRIAELALDLPASLVVTGSRLLTGIRALRSVSERVGAIAPCSVLVMRRAT